VEIYCTVKNDGLISGIADGLVISNTNKQVSSECEEDSVIRGDS